MPQLPQYVTQQTVVHMRPPVMWLYNRRSLLDEEYSNFLNRLETTFVRTSYSREIQIIFPQFFEPRVFVALSVKARRGVLVGNAAPTTVD